MQHIDQVQRPFQTNAPASPFFRVSETVAWRLLDECIVIVNLKNAQIHKLRSAEKAIWLSLVTGNSYQDTFHTIVENYEVGELVAERDLKAFVQELLDSQLLERSEEASEWGGSLCKDPNEIESPPNVEQVISEIVREKLASGKVLQLKVETNSMWPLIGAGDSVEISAIGAIRIGDVIAYPHKEGFCIHRVRRIKNFRGVEYVKTRGDLRSTSDRPLLILNCVGKVSCVCKGGLKISLNSPFGRLLSYVSRPISRLAAKIGSPQDYLIQFVVLTSKRRVIHRLYMRLYYMTARFIALLLRFRVGIRSVYIQGSVATGEFVPGISDLDIAVILDTLLEEEESHLIHWIQAVPRKMRFLCPIFQHVWVFPVDFFRFLQRFGGMRAIETQRWELLTEIDSREAHSFDDLEVQLYAIIEIHLCYYMACFAGLGCFQGKKNLRRVQYLKLAKFSLELLRALALLSAPQELKHLLKLGRDGLAQFFLVNERQDLRELAYAIQKLINSDASIDQRELVVKILHSMLVCIEVNLRGYSESLPVRWAVRFGKNSNPLTIYDSESLRGWLEEVDELHRVRWIPIDGSVNIISFRKILLRNLKQEGFSAFPASPSFLWLLNLIDISRVTTPIEDLSKIERVVFLTLIGQCIGRAIIDFGRLDRHSRSFIEKLEPRLVHIQNFLDDLGFTISKSGEKLSQLENPSTRKILEFMCHSLFDAMNGY